MRQQGAVLIDFHTDFPFIADYRQAFEPIAPSITLNNYRFIFYLEYLKNNTSRYNNIMLTDIRDVVFQKDIFNELADDKIYFFLEDASEVFRTSQLNYKWCLQANGAMLTNEIIDQNVSCAGIVIGSYSLIAEYLNYIKSRLLNRDDLPWGMDQGVHNAYIYTVPNTSAIIIPNTYPLVLTLGACKTFTQNANGLLVNSNDIPYVVVHQYDRFGHLIVYFKAKYIGNRLMQILKKAWFAILP